MFDNSNLNPMKRSIALGIAVVIAILATTKVEAQQEQQYTQYMLNNYSINPAVGGTEDFIDVKASYRLQWAGLESRPRTIYLSGHSTIGKEFGSGHGHHRNEHKSWHGVGGYIYDDKTGPISRSGFYASYAYNLPINNEQRLSIGAFVGLKQFRLGTDWEAYHAGDQLINDATELTKIVPDVSIGVYYYSQYFYLGGSMLNAIQSKLSFQGLGDSLQLSNGKLNSHFMFTGGFKMPLNTNLSLIPSMAVKAVYPSPLSIDVNILLMFQNMAFVGANYRVKDSFSIIVGGVITKQLDVSYSYDLTTSDLRNYNTGSHEIIIGYRFKHAKHLDCPSRWWH